MENKLLKWKYTFRNTAAKGCRDDWHETYETIYDDKLVLVGVRVANFKLNYDGLFLKICFDLDKNDFIGLMTGVNRPEETRFLKPLKPSGHQPMDKSEAPRLEDFIKEYRSIFESQRELRETYRSYL